MIDNSDSAHTSRVISTNIPSRSKECNNNNFRVFLALWPPRYKLSFITFAEPNAFFFTNHTYFTLLNLETLDSPLTIPLMDGANEIAYRNFLGSEGWLFSRQQNVISKLCSLFVLFNRPMDLYFNL